MTTITDADRAAAASVAVLTEMRELILAGRADHHAEIFARHREAALEDAARAFKSAQYSPAPYTDGMKALRRLMDDPA